MYTLYKPQHSGIIKYITFIENYKIQITSLVMSISLVKSYLRNTIAVIVY